ncbi:hypothetical protein Tco_0202009 [Tanacetum coccineum]
MVLNKFSCDMYLMLFMGGSGAGGVRLVYFSEIRTIMNKAEKIVLSLAEFECVKLDCVGSSDVSTENIVCEAPVVNRSVFDSTCYTLIDSHLSQYDMLDLLTREETSRPVTEPCEICNFGSWVVVRYRCRVARLVIQRHLKPRIGALLIRSEFSMFEPRRRAEDLVRVSQSPGNFSPQNYTTA